MGGGVDGLGVQRRIFSGYAANTTTRVSRSFSARRLCSPAISALKLTCASNSLADIMTATGLPCLEMMTGSVCTLSSRALNWFLASEAEIVSIRNSPSSHSLFAPFAGVPKFSFDPVAVASSDTVRPPYAYSNATILCEYPETSIHAGLHLLSGLDRLAARPLPRAVVSGPAFFCAVRLRC